MRTPNSDMKAWLNEASQEERQRVASEAGTSVGYLWLLAGGHRNPSEDLAFRLHQATQGKVSAMSFFPKLAAIASNL